MKKLVASVVMLVGMVSLVHAAQIDFGFATQLIQPWAGTQLPACLSTGLAVRVPLAENWRLVSFVEMFKDKNTMRPQLSSGPVWLLGSRLILGFSGMVRLDSHVESLEAWGGSIAPGVKISQRVNLVFPCGKVRLVDPAKEVTFASIKLVVWF